MHLRHLQLINFKNYEGAETDFSPNINVLVGNNGSGKTNLLDSIYFLSMTKSAFSVSDQQCIRLGESFSLIKGAFERGGKQLDVSAAIQVGAKKSFREEGVEYTKVGDHIGKFPVVLISPDDTELIREGGEPRRKFFDGMISQLDRQYLEALIQYHAALKQRNSLLRMFNHSGRFDALALEAYDRLLIRNGEFIYQRRKQFVQEFAPVFHTYHEFIVSAEKVDLQYESGLDTKSFADGLAESLHKDQFLLRTGFGIHRDDFIFKMAEGDLKRLGSQGQQKSFVIALKLAQHKIIQTHKGFRPILLLDDIFDKLDDRRITRLIALMREDSGQIFISDARPDRTKDLLKGIDASASMFTVEDGHLRPA